MGALMRQTPHCGVHVHVGMPDGESAVRAANGMRAWIPLLQALAANSPYWYGRDSGLASARAVSATPCPFRRAAGVRRLRRLRGGRRGAARARRVPGQSFLWWDFARTRRLGTLEIRACDAQSSLDDLAALVALVHCLAVHEAIDLRRRRPGPEALRELCFRASRDGLDGRSVHNGVLRPVREVAFEAVALAGAYAADLGCWDELMLVHRLLETGNGACAGARRRGGRRAS